MILFSAAPETQGEDQEERRDYEDEVDDMLSEVMSQDEESE